MLYKYRRLQCTPLPLLESTLVAWLLSTLRPSFSVHGTVANIKPRKYADRVNLILSTLYTTLWRMQLHFLWKGTIQGRWKYWPMYTYVYIICKNTHTYVRTCIHICVCTYVRACERFSTELAFIHSSILFFNKLDIFFRVKTRNAKESQEACLDEFFLPKKYDFYHPKEYENR